MSDDVDIATERIALTISRGLEQVRRAIGLHSDGRCHFCEEPVPDALLFCDVDCRDDYEREQAARRRSGHQMEKSP